MLRRAARRLEVTTPGGFDAVVRENSVAAESAVIPSSSGLIDPAALGKSAAGHHVPLVGPPLGAA